MDVLSQFRADRAFNEGQAAFLLGHPRHAPERFGVYSGDWVRGWEAASLEQAQPKAA